MNLNSLQCLSLRSCACLHPHGLLCQARGPDLPCIWGLSFTGADTDLRLLAAVGMLTSSSSWHVMITHAPADVLLFAKHGISGQNLMQLQVAKSMLAPAGVLPFAKRGDERGNNLVRLQQMFPRIVAANFAQPHHISPECKHLLSRLLTADPEKRITVAEILQHPWFRKDLAPGTADMNYNLLQVWCT